MIQNVGRIGFMSFFRHILQQDKFEHDLICQMEQSFDF